MARKCEFAVFVSVSSKIPNTVFFYFIFIFFGLVRGILPRPGIPKAQKNVERHALLPNTLAFVLYLKPLSNYLWYSTHTDTFFKGSLAKFCHLAPVVQECGGIKEMRGLLSLVFDSPLELCGPGDKVA